LDITVFLKEATWNGQPENSINIDVKEMKSSPVGVPAENILLTYLPLYTEIPTPLTS
jgi:hypothetical protein